MPTLAITDLSTTAPATKAQINTAFAQIEAVVNALDSTNMATGFYAATIWTPVLTFATPGTLAVTYTTQTGRYTRIGNLVIARCLIVLNAWTLGTATGNLRVTGLPIAASASHVGASPVEMSGVDIPAANMGIFAHAVAGQTYVEFYSMADNAARTQLIESNALFATTDRIEFTLMYEV